jgi:hypothetical protein
MMTEWQPIATAPKDGTVILVTNGWNIACARWDDDSWPYAANNARWSISDWHNDPIHLRGGYMSTHWMPLPSLPESKP